MLFRIAMCVEYNGTGYQGWQKQPHTAKTIQAQVEQAISLVANEAIAVVCSGRTDAGVHAAGQIIHFDTKAQRASYNWVLGCNANLPPEIKIIWAQPVVTTFNARHSALWRRYVYVVANNLVAPVIGGNYLTWHRKKLCLTSMSLAAKEWIGEHDFTTFRDTECQSKSAIRCIKDFKITRIGDFIFFDISANAFLQHMVRNMVGSLFLVGEGKVDHNWAKEILQQRDRKVAGMTAPAQGLFLFEVGYELTFNLPRPNRAWIFNYGGMR